MILDHIKNCSAYFSSHSSLKQTFEFLQKINPEELEFKTYHLDKENLYITISDNIGKQLSEAKLEVHKKYIDVHLLLSGDEKIGWKPLEECKAILSPYVEEKDISFYLDEPQTYMKLYPGTFAVFFPEDAHAPLISNSRVIKAIAKIKI